MLRVTEPFPIFYDTDGTPLDDGMIYVGVINQDPRSNPVQVYWDSALTIPATQPIRTLNGRPAYQGAPANFYTEDVEYSIAVFDRLGAPVINPTNVTPATSGDFPTAAARADKFTANGTQTDFTLSASPATVNSLDVSIDGVTQVPGDDYTLGGSETKTLTFTTAPPAAAVVLAKYQQTLPSFGGSADDIVLDNGRTVQAKADELVSVKDKGAVGDGVANDSPAFTLAAPVVDLLVPAGTYNLATDVTFNGARSWRNVGTFTGTGVLITTPDYTGFNYTVDLRKVRLAESRGTAASPVTDKDAVALFSKHVSANVAASAQNAALVAQTYKWNTNSLTVAQAVFAEAIDRGGNAVRDDFVEGGRFHGIGFGGKAYGVVSLGQVGDGITAGTAKYAIGNESEVIRAPGTNAVDPQTWTAANNLDAPYLATVRFGAKAMGGFIVNPFNSIACRVGFGVFNTFAARGATTPSVDFASFFTNEVTPYALYARNVSFAVISGPNNVAIVRALNAAGSAEHNILSYGTDNTVTLGAEASGVRVRGNVILNPPASTTPGANGELVIEATSNTTLTFRLRGSDGTVRSGTITLS